MTKLADRGLFGLIHDFLKVYLPKHRHVSSNTIIAYRKALDQLIDFVKNKNSVVLQDVTFDMLGANTVLAFLDALENERGCGVSTRNHRLAAIRAFFTYAANMDITAVKFLEEIKKVPLKKNVPGNTVEHMSENAIQVILSQPDATTSKGLRNRFFMVLMYDTGARMQEVLDIKLRDLRLGKTPTVTLHGKGDKTRSVPLMERTSEHLRVYLAEFHKDSGMSADAYLFYLVSHGQAHQLSDDCAAKFIHKYGELARAFCPEVPANVHAHQFRHSRAMHLYQNGMDLTLIAQWLGHANLETTQIYAKADTEHKRKAIAMATPPKDPMHKLLNPARLTITDEEQLKLLYGLR